MTQLVDRWHGSAALKAKLSRTAVYIAAFRAGPHRDFHSRRRRGNGFRLSALVAVNISSEIHLSARAGPVIRIFSWKAWPLYARRQRRCRCSTLVTLTLRSEIHFSALTGPIAFFRFAASWCPSTPKLSHVMRSCLAEHSHTHVRSEWHELGPDQGRQSANH